MTSKELVLYRPDGPRPQRVIDAAFVEARVEARMSNAFRLDTRRRQQHRRPDRITLSMVGSCLRKLAYALSGTPCSEPLQHEEGRQAAIGTWIHLHLLPLMQELTPGAMIELAVVLRAAGLELHGSLDWLWVDPETGEAEVGDVKSVREWKINVIDRIGVIEEHEYQVWSYALATAQLFERLNLPYKVRWVWWLYIDRSTGQVRVKATEFTNEQAYAVLTRVALIKKSAAAPDKAKQEARGPGISPVCDGCRWLRTCWDEDARPGERGPQRILALTPEGILEALGLLHTANGVKNAAEKDIEFAKLVLAGTPDGDYGPYKLKRRPTGKMLDQKYVRQDYATRGQEPPMVDKAKALIVTSTGTKG